jgi:hypothetical protein
MSISPLKTARSRRAVAAGLVVAIAFAGTAAAASTASAAPASAASAATSAAQQPIGTGGGKTTVGKVTWSILPATPTGPDKTRVLFNYQTIIPGTTIIDHVEIVNDSKQSAAFSIYGTDATGTSPQDALLLLPPTKKPTDIGSWVTFPGGAATLSTIIPADKAIDVQFDVKIPLLATPGDHTGGMVAQVGIPHRTSAGISVVENYRIAVPIEMRVPGALRSGLQVQSVSTGFSDPINPFGTGSATISYSVANTGNVRLSGTQAVTVTAPFGQKETVTVPALPTVLPGDSVRYTVAVPGLFPAGPMTAHIAVNPAWPATTLPLKTALSPVADSASLFAMPWSLLGLVLLLIALGVGVWWLLRIRRREHRAEIAAAADKARRETTRRLLGTRRAAGTTAGTTTTATTAAGTTAAGAATTGTTATGTTTAETTTESSGPDPDAGSTTE